VRGAPWWHASGGKEPPVAGRRRVQGSARRSWSSGEFGRRRPRGTVGAAGPCGGARWIGDWMAAFSSATLGAVA
jgi:hypothetical protein